MLEEELRVASEAARKAGSILKARFGSAQHIRKKGAINLVTDSDLQAEKAILQAIRNHFPSDQVIAEESGTEGKSNERVWVVDPLDGTTNFVHGYPFFAVSIALQLEGEIALGIVYNPYFEEYFEAVKGSGAFLNRRPITVSKVTDIGESLLATGFPYDIQDDADGVLELFGRFLKKAQGVRRPGSAALDLCYVACGRIDGFWEKGLEPWDTAAGAIIVREAGGMLKTYRGSPYSPYEKSVVASNPALLEKMLGIINKEQ
ncbi:MAG TPA: inositol monophosphatase [Desulfobacteraceae bacterium]|nr:MAG: inositol monophosphatase [Deltaproteobacteria bacterium]HDZ24312.1 inositol monophosphatase [Desulfobacteraceae bacterium]